MSELNKQQLQAACDYINAHVKEIYGFDDGVDVVAQVGQDIGPEQVVKSRVEDGELVLLVDRGIKGMPKYRLDAAAVEAYAAQQKAANKPKPKPAPAPAPAVKAATKAKEK